MTTQKYKIFVSKEAIDVDTGKVYNFKEKCIGKVSTAQEQLFLINEFLYPHKGIGYPYAVEPIKKCLISIHENMIKRGKKGIDTSDRKHGGCYNSNSPTFYCTYTFRAELIN